MKKPIIHPCLSCDGTDIEIYSCGYSTFDMGGGRCKSCNAKFTDHVGISDPDGDALKIWNVNNNLKLLISDKRSELNVLLDIKKRRALKKALTKSEAA